MAARRKETMIGLDKNVLVRLLVRDDPDQTEQARRFIDSRCTPESPGFINCVVLAELVRVLDSVYRFPRPQIAAAIENLMMGRDRIVESHDDVRGALADYQASNIDFTDALICRINL